nr:MAG TPA: hypothetical protein [Caudoviricetes sp.]DAR30034.1 MAG TPA: hypothetical protein [Caudoviricetes sp.]
MRGGNPLIFNQLTLDLIQNYYKFIKSNENIYENDY